MTSSASSLGSKQTGTKPMTGAQMTRARNGPKENLKVGISNRAKQLDVQQITASIGTDEAAVDRMKQSLKVLNL